MQKLSDFQKQVTIIILEILKEFDQQFIPMCLRVATNTSIEFGLKQETALEIANNLVNNFLDIQREKWNGFLEYIDFTPKLSSKEINELIKSLIEGK